MTIRLAGLVAPLVLLAGADFASAQYRGAYGGARVGGTPTAGTPGSVQSGGFQPGYRGSLNNYGYRGGFNNYGYRGGLGIGYPYTYGYYNGGYGYSGLGYGFGGQLGFGSGYGSGAFPLTYGMGRAYDTPAAPPAIKSYYTIPAVPVETFSADPAPAVVNFVLPDGAKLWIDGKETSAPDGKYTYKSPVIKTGHGPTLNVKARWDDSTREMNLTIRAGDKMTVDLRNQ